MKPNPPADKYTLIRRATFDLTGLPPTESEVQRYLVDDSPDAWTKVVDRLLASPHYGERWGRHWMDVAHYADTAGDNADYPVPELATLRCGEIGPAIVTSSVSGPVSYVTTSGRELAKR